MMKSEKIHVRVRPAEKFHLQALAASEGVTLSELIRGALRELGILPEVRVRGMKVQSEGSNDGEQ